MRKVNIKNLLKKHRIKILLGLFLGLVLLTLNKNREKLTTQCNKPDTSKAPCLDGQCGEIKTDINGKKTKARCDSEFPIWLGNCKMLKKINAKLPKMERMKIIYGENCDCSACPASGDKDNPSQKWEAKCQRCVTIPCDEDCDCKFSKRLTKAANSNYKKCEKDSKKPECSNQQKADNKCS